MQRKDLLWFPPLRCQTRFKYALEPLAPRQVTQHHGRTPLRSLHSEHEGEVQRQAGKRWDTQILVPALLTAFDNCVRLAGWLAGSWFFQWSSFMCENAYTTGSSTWPKIAVVEHSEVGDPCQAYTYTGVCSLAKKLHLCIWSQKWSCEWMKLVPFITLSLHILFHLPPPTHI